MDNGPELISHALQRFCENKVGIIYIPPDQPWNNGFIESFNSRLRKECLNRNYWTDLLERPADITPPQLPTDGDQQAGTEVA